jgi:hypothetical protein
MKQKSYSLNRIYNSLPSCSKRGTNLKHSQLVLFCAWKWFSSLQGECIPNAIMVPWKNKFRRQWYFQIHKSWVYLWMGFLLLCLHEWWALNPIKLIDGENKAEIVGTSSIHLSLNTNTNFELGIKGSNVSKFMRICLLVICTGTLEMKDNKVIVLVD